MDIAMAFLKEYSWLLLFLIIVNFELGFLLGIWAEARQWREKGNHEYMNTKESTGRFYTVKREGWY